MPAAIDPEFLAFLKRGAAGQGGSSGPTHSSTFSGNTLNTRVNFEPVQLPTYMDKLSQYVREFEPAPRTRARVQGAALAPREPRYRSRPQSIDTRRPGGTISIYAPGHMGSSLNTIPQLTYTTDPFLLQRGYLIG